MKCSWFLTIFLPPGKADERHFLPYESFLWSLSEGIVLDLLLPLEKAYLFFLKWWLHDHVPWQKVRTTSQETNPRRWKTVQHSLLTLKGDVNTTCVSLIWKAKLKPQSDTKKRETNSLTPQPMALVSEVTGLCRAGISLTKMDWIT